MQSAGLWCAFGAEFIRLDMAAECQMVGICRSFFCATESPIFFATCGAGKTQQQTKGGGFVPIGCDEKNGTPRLGFRFLFSGVTIISQEA
jgi:hypothetical protein